VVAAARGAGEERLGSVRGIGPKIETRNSKFENRNSGISERSCLSDLNFENVARAAEGCEEKNGTPGGWAVPLIPPPERTNSAGVPVTGNVILRISKTCQLLFLLNCWQGST
jgi:hypothetical protein